MTLKKTEKKSLTSKEILDEIADYESNQVKEFDKLWEYYKGHNTKIMNRKTPDSNTPDNKVPVPYGRKIVTTFTGYAYRPRYITYKAVESEEMAAERRRIKEEEKVAEKEARQQAIMNGQPIPISPPPESEPPTEEEAYVSALQDIFDKNNEHIKTSRAGRNTGIFGVAYELLYIKGTVDTKAKPKIEGEAIKLPVKAEVRFFPVDPRELILYYNFASEPEKVFAIRFYPIVKGEHYKVEVYYPNKVEVYDRKRTKDAMHTSKWILTPVRTDPNFFGEIPVAAYYFGDEMNGIIEPVIPLINAYDVLISDSLNEFDRFAYAYLIMKRFGLTDPTKKKEAGVVSRVLQNLKRRRVFENLPADADIKFLTKDIPHEFIKFVSDWLREQIHVQSHVPDFTSEKMSSSGLSGIAVQRLLFDFENVVSSTEADFDVGLIERIRLISIVMNKTKSAAGAQDMVSISHKRNVPLNLKEFADTSKTMKDGGFSSWLAADIWPDDVIPNVEEELARQKEEAEERMPDIEQINVLKELTARDEEEEIEEEE